MRGWENKSENTPISNARVGTQSARPPIESATTAAMRGACQARSGREGASANIRTISARAVSQSAKMRVLRPATENAMTAAMRGVEVRIAGRSTASVVAPSEPAATTGTTVTSAVDRDVSVTTYLPSVSSAAPLTMSTCTTRKTAVTRRTDISNL
eukprot:IDg10995t1